MSRLNQRGNKPRGAGDEQPSEALLAAIDLTDALFEMAKQLVQKDDRFRHLTLYPPKQVTEPKLGEYTTRINGRTQPPPSYYRWRASAQKNTLSVRSDENRIEVFIIPRDDVPLRSYAEYGQRLQVLLEQDRNRTAIWYVNGQKLTLDQLNNMMLTWMQRLIAPNAAPANAERRPKETPEPAKTTADNLSAMEKQNLVYRLLNQQESLKNDVARELHDTVIADLMTLKRNLSGRTDADPAELSDAIQSVIDRLRDICGEFAPRLQDWGLHVAIEALVERLEQRGSLDCIFNCDDELPSLPDTVELNVFRIIQECLNNVSKYAQATRVIVTLACPGDGTLLCSVQDNGVGFDPSLKVRSGSSGLGLGSMRDRVEVIRAFCPATLKINSAPGEGTKISLTIGLP